ncbi:MAG: 4Fe-4S dicluster domain-containing protein [Nitrososphaerota archaeon]|jgi:formate hydrogenlyase subunit 6/NADH:ubiquinone oxidoreductase subunit I|nr:4Fe-4S dicluster domain-containing protein [Nitrososphaerota archaeon]
MARILVRLNEALVSEPIVSEVILENKVLVAILAAHINSKGGEIILEVLDDDVDKLVSAFRQKGVTVTVPKIIAVDTDRCFSCGSCVALCPVEAITVTEDLTIHFSKEKCVGSACNLCVDTCPVRAINSTKYSKPENLSNRNEYREK